MLGMEPMKPITIDVTDRSPIYPTVLPQNGDLTLAEQAVVGAVIAPIARRMALVMAQRAHLAACDEILRRIEAENTTTVLGNTRLDAIFTIVKAVRSSQPQVG